MRSPQNVVREIERDVKELGAKSIAFQDDTFTWDEKWLEETCALMKEKFGGKVKFRINSRVNTINENKLTKLKAAGCTLISFGVESGSQRILDNILCKGVKIEQTINAFKLCRKIGIRPAAYIMIGNPTETKKDIEETIELIKKIQPFNIYAAVTTPLPKTKLYEICESMGILKQEGETFCYRRFDSLPLNLKELTLEDIQKTEKRISEMAKQYMHKWLMDEYFSGIKKLRIVETIKVMKEDAQTFLALK